MNEYQRAAVGYLMEPRLMGPTFKDGVDYCTLGINEEAGEIAGKAKKAWRDEGGEYSQERIRAIALEIGDVLWYCAMLAEHIGYTLDDIAGMNIAKLEDRRRRGKIVGSGDNR